MKFKSWKRVFSGILAAVTVISSCTAGPVMAASEETETGYPTLQEVIDQLDEDEIVRPSDYIVPVGSDFNIKVDFSNLDVPDWSKVNLYFDGAYNENGEFFTTDHADSYRAVYHVEPVSGHPVYQISRNVRVREAEKPKETTENTVPSTNATGSTDSSGYGTDSGNSGIEKETENDTSDDESQSDESGLSAADSSGDDSSNAEVNNDGSTTEPNDTTDSSGNTDTPDQSKDLSTESEGPGAASDAENDSSVAEIGEDKEQPVMPDDESSVSVTTESLSTESITSEKVEPDEAKPSVLSTIISGITSLFKSDEVTVPEDELIEDPLVGASGAAVDATVYCTSSSFSSVFVDHAYQTSGNSNGDVILYCGEVDIHFSEGTHTRQDLVGTSLEGHTVTAADALRVGIMQYYFWNKAGVDSNKARGLTQRAVWAMAVGDEAGGVSNTVWLTQAGLLDVYNAGKSYASSNASKFELGECYALVMGSSQKLVYLSVSEKPDEGSAKLVKKSSDGATSGNSSYSLKGAVYGVYSDKACTKKVKELTTGADGTSNTVKLSAGTYYVKEITAPKNFKKDENVHTVKVESGKTATVTVNDTPEKTPFHILKVSEDGGAMPVTGTVYTVYSDKDCTASVGTLTVGADGKSNTLSVLYGTYYVKETKAAEGYALDTEVHVVECKDSKEVEVRLSDKVVRAGVMFTKSDADLGRNEAQGSGTLKGATIEIYSDNDYDIVVNGKTIKKGETVVRLSSDSDGVMKTDANVFPLGSYTWEETKAPEGYSIGDTDNSVTKGKFDIAAEDAGTVKDLTGNGPSDAVLRAGIRFDKQDLDMKAATPQGDASLEGAEIEVTSENENPVVVAGKEYKKGDVVLILKTGKSGTVSTPVDMLPLGSYSWKETKVPAGYLLEGTVSGKFTLTEKDAATIKDFSGKGPSDQIIRGGVKIGKWEAETKRRDPQGGSSLNETTFAIVNKSNDSVLVDGKTYEPGATIATIKTDKDGYWESREKWLPYGSYAAIETKAPEGHTLTGTVKNFEIRNDGEIIDLDQGQFENQVFRGDLELVKAGQSNKERLANVPFLITSKTTGEEHVIVTDPNGQAGTGTKYADHTANTNKNDEAYKDGKVDDAKLSYTYGVWFSGESDVTVEPDNAKGALPYDTYTVKELRCKANEGYELVSYEITVYRDGYTVDSGTVDDEETPKIELSTQAKNNEAKAPDGEHIALAAENCSITDTVSYAGLTAGKTYTLKTVLMDKVTGETVKTPDGNEVFVETEMKIHFWNKSGTKDVPITFDASALEGHSVVVFEYLYDEDMEEIAKHTDIDNAGQTIVFPKARTKASDEVTKTNIVNPSKNIKVKDILYYENLLVGKEYLVTATLMDKKTEKPILDDDGNEVTTMKRFTAESSDGSLDIVFEFPGVKLQGTVMVAFEKVSIQGIEIIAHANINDLDQTLYTPRILTTASEKDTGAKEMESSGTKELTDHVLYECLPEGDYVMQGILMDKASGKPVMDADGKEITSSQTFKADANGGYVDMNFSVHADELSGKTVVVFEKVYQADENGEPVGDSLANHEDLNDISQAVTFPSIATELIDEQTGNHRALAGKKVKHIDHVKYTGLIVGNEYTVKGVLVDKASGEKILDGGKEVVAQLAFKAEKTDGVVDLTFEFDASALEGKSVVAFEDLYKEERLITSHSSLSDMAQTIWYPKIFTELKDNASDSHTALAAEKMELTDTVTYTNLEAGRKYSVKGILMDKETGEPLKINNETVTAATEFTPKDESGTVELTFSVNGLSLAGKTVVAFETLYDDSIELAIHADINDEAQAIVIPGISTEFINNESNSHTAEALNPRNFTDTVLYKNLDAGVEYTISGVLMDKATGDKLLIGGKEVTAAKLFRPEESDGNVELAFEFDCTSLAGKEAVAFEYLYKDKQLIAYHADIYDKAQTVGFHKPGETPTPTPKAPTPTPRSVTPVPSTPRTPSRASVVKTGDTQNVVVPVLMLLGAACVLGGIMLTVKKRKH